MDKELIMYGRSYGCPYIRIAKMVLEAENVPFLEIQIDQDRQALRRVQEWTGYRSVPTLVVAEAGEVLPFEPPEPLRKGKSPRGIDRGSMITEPDDLQLKAWLKKHDFIEG